METLQNDACGGKFMIKSRMIAIAVALTMLFCSAFSVAAESDAEWTCPSCGSINSSNFCPKCGEARPEQVTCPGCGAVYQLENGYVFCPECGTKLFQGGSEGIIEVEIGSYITFGSYEQDNDLSNGKEDIEWLVLAKEDDRILVISRYGLDAQPYNTEREDVTWETCTLRTWLNGSFLNEAFSADEQAMIPSITVSADKNPDWDTDPGSDTTGQVFLLSIPEVNKYFSSDEARQCKPTVYAEAQGCYEQDGNCIWRLRSPGFSSDFATYVDDDGSVESGGSFVDRGYGAVRPALWITLEP